MNHWYLVRLVACFYGYHFYPKSAYVISLMSNLSGNNLTTLVDRKTDKLGHRRSAVH